MCTCLPKKCLKVYLSFSAILIILLGAAIIIASAVQFSNTDIVSGDQKSAVMATMWVLIGLGAFLIFIGLIGLCGTLKKSSCLLFLANIFIIIFFLLFLAIGVACLYLFGSDNALVNNFEECRKLEFLKGPDDYALDAQKYLCSPYCPCNGNLLTIQSQIIKTTNNQTMAAIVDVDSKGAKKVQECPEFQTRFSSYSQYFDVVGTLEEKFNCAGICTKLPYYIFTDVNRGDPEDKCSTKIIDFIKKYGIIVGSISIIISFLLLLNIILSCCLSRHPNKDDNTN